MRLVHTVRPPAAPSERPPALILLHGVGSNEQSMAGVARRVDPRWFVVCARSPIALGPNAFAWFHVTFTPDGPVIDREEAERGWKGLAAFVDEVVSTYGVDPSRVFLGGFSQGAILSLATLLTAPDRVAGALAMSGRLLPEVLPHAAPAEALRDKPVLLLHGTADDRLGVHYARQAKERLQPFALDLAYEELPIGHTMTEASLAVANRWLAGVLERR